MLKVVDTLPMPRHNDSAPELKYPATRPVSILTVIFVDQ